MTAWQPIPKDGDIPHDDCVIVRRRNRSGKWGIEIAYRSVGNGWRVSGGEMPVTTFEEWFPIPK